TAFDVAGPPGLPPLQEEKSRGGFFRDPISIVLVVVIVFALAIAGLVGAEMYARNRGETVVAGVVKCVVEDDASVSFGSRPFLWQHMNETYNDLTITTAGNNIRDAKGMKLQVQMQDIQLVDNTDAKGTVGRLQANITWSTDGIKQSLQSLPLIGSFITELTTNPDDETIELAGSVFGFLSGTIVARPQVVNNELKLEVVEVTGVGLTLPSESVQPVLDEFTASLIDGYPMGIRPESVDVTEEGVVSQFGAQNATIPRTDNPCFDAL
ncbi:MAG: LmeA family phospholipid-binding protein, partial [Mycobacterium sp.]